MSLLSQTETRWAEAYWRIASADEAFNGSRSRATSALYASYLELRTLMKDGPLTRFGNLSPAAFQYTICLGYQLMRRPFISSAGYIGLVPVDAAAGDLLAAVRDASVPYVFRRRDGGRDGWQLVGEAYIDGLMDGEVLAAETIEPEVLQIY
jgi:hypothetical protein